MAKISVYIIAYNQAHKIEAAINSVLWADEIIVADSYSTDGTAEIAERLGAKIVQIPFKGFGDLRNQALSVCQYEWIFNLDSDERCTPDARDEILKIINQPVKHDIYYVPRRNFFMGRWIKHSGWYPNYRQPQLFRKNTLTYTPLVVHEGFVSHSTKPIGFLQAALWQIPFENLTELIQKANRYSSLGAEKLAAKNSQPSLWQAYWHGAWAFIKHYLFKKGFLDGWPGFIIALGNFEGTFYRYAKHYEQANNWPVPASPPLQRLEEKYEKK